jgi:hypothetical protein
MDFWMSSTHRRSSSGLSSSPRPWQRSSSNRALSLRERATDNRDTNLNAATVEDAALGTLAFPQSSPILTATNGQTGLPTSYISIKGSHSPLGRIRPFFGNIDFGQSALSATQSPSTTSNSGSAPPARAGAGAARSTPVSVAGLPAPSSTPPASASAGLPPVRTRGTFLPPQ